MGGGCLPEQVYREIYDVANETQPYSSKIGDDPERHSRLGQQSDLTDLWLDDLIRQNRIALHKALARVVSKAFLPDLEIIEARKRSRGAK